MSLFFKILLMSANIALVSSVYSTRSFSHRKSLRFQPILPHATFVTSLPPRLVNSTFKPSSFDSDPLVIAREFLDVLLQYINIENNMSYEIRNDSYTDTRTGVTHVYVKQIVHDLEVSNGLINMNVFKGEVISYGDSFFRGPALSENVITTPSIHQKYCRTLAKQSRVHLDLQEIYDANCGFLFRNISVFSEYRLAEDPRPAVLMFVIAATPSISFADALSSDFDQHLSQILAHSLDPSDHRFELESVPEAIGVVPVHKAYIQIPDGNSNHLRLVWKFEIQMKDNWYEVATDVLDPSNIISVIDWASDGRSPSAYSNMQRLATYRVYKWGVGDPSQGERSLQQESTDPKASPHGWQKIPTSFVPPSLAGSGFRDPVSQDTYQFTVTAGNNIFAQTNWNGGNKWENNPRPNAGPSLNFDYPYNLNAERTNLLQLARSFASASITQVFYTLNQYHDFLYLYGFDEVSGNFQVYNSGRGGKERDAVIVYGQDGSGYNDAFFVTPPDGLSGECHMFLWDVSNPYRDGDFEASIPIHEYTHGLSTRLTGGPADSGCLGGKEAGGMGEGWGDLFAIMINSNPKLQDRYAVMSPWASNNPHGIRHFPYSLNKNDNPLTYKAIDKLSTVHSIGEVWAEILWVVNHKLVEKHGFAEDTFPPKLKVNHNGTIPANDFYRPVKQDVNSDERTPLVPQHGNTLMIQLLINAMKLQPCNPGFIAGRDAIIQADKVLTRGENFCALWKGFAERGLGVKAKFVYNSYREEDFTVPGECWYYSGHVLIIRLVCCLLCGYNRSCCSM